jgi:hypothetical protein
MKDKYITLAMTIGFVLLCILGWWAVRTGYYDRYCSSPWVSYTSQCRTYRLFTR